jgi:hypothetical protein
MIFENVPQIINMLTPEGLSVMSKFCRILEDGGFGTVKALERSLLATSGAGGVIRKTPKNPNKRKDDGNRKNNGQKK